MFNSSFPDRTSAENVHGGGASQYLLTLEQMIENDYPIPSYMADVFQKPEGWLETPQESSALDPKQERILYAVDCEMVYIILTFTFILTKC